MSYETYLENIQKLKFGMDVIIIAVTSAHETEFWQRRLDQMRGQVIKEDALLINVVEDWSKGAGNALGTFYAFEKACKKSLQHYQLDLRELLDHNKSIAIYHTAGKGTRLAPMTGCEYNSKSRIRLGSRLRKKNHETSSTILEAVIRQTSILAPHSKGRVSVFWGDQIFIPSHELSPPKHDINLLVKTLNYSPSKEAWEKEGFSKYGLVLVNPDQSFQQLEKLTFEQFSELKISKDQKLAFSLGCFSLSKKAMDAFCKEFVQELSQKTSSLDTDPHLWMPLTLDQSTYSHIMQNKGIDPKQSQLHWERLQKFKIRFENKTGSKALLSSTDMGCNTLWWDYGNLKSYFDNHLKLVQESDESQLLRHFFNLSEADVISHSKPGLKVENSILINCKIHKGHIKNSILIDVTADDATTDRALILHTSAQKIEANQAILYNALENGTLKVSDNQIRADSFSNENGHIKLFNSIQANLSWEQPVEGNSLSFQDLHKINQVINPVKGQQLAQIMHNKIKQAVFDLQK